MPDSTANQQLQAIRHFQYARWQASLEQILAFFKGPSTELLSYEETRRLLRAYDTNRTVRKDIPLDSIVGSVGRYTDFTRSFLPLRDSDMHRWASVEVGLSSLTGLPPIEVYQIDEAYFVKDGNHRVSVARQKGFTTIEAYVTIVQTKAPLTPDMRPDDLILAGEYADFLERTRLDELRPGADLRVTETGRYEELIEQIDAHRYHLELERGKAPTYEEAVLHWYDTVYLPLKQLIEERGILRDFPDRTPLDLYVWIGRHRMALSDTLGMDVPTDLAVADLAAQHSDRPDRVAARWGGRLLDALTPDSLEGGPEVGAWRRTRTGLDRQSLFANILVPITGEEEHWYALQQAVLVAQRERGRVHGLHVVASARQRDSDKVRKIEAEFYRRSSESGVPVQFEVEVGPVTRTICSRTRWTDLTVVRVVYPPAPNPIRRLGSGIRTMLRRCTGPLLITPKAWHRLERPLVPYNLTPTAQEALYVTAYLAGRWELTPTVLTIGADAEKQEAALAKARAYLESQKVQAQYETSTAAVVEAVLQSAERLQTDLIIMGGYSSTPVGEIVKDSNVNGLIRTGRLPILVCR